MAAVDAEVVVVGAGAMGLATACALGLAGRDVLLLEQFSLGHDRGSSHGSSRIFRLSYPDVEWVRRAAEALPLWRQLEADCGETLLELHGSVDLGSWGANRDALAAAGVAFEVLGRAEADRRFGLRLAPGEQALYQADGGIALAEGTLRALLESALSSGVAVRERAAVAAVREVGGVVEVALDGETLKVRAAVVTAGAWAQRLVELDAQPTRETVAYFDCSGPVPSLIDGPLAAGSLGYGLVAPGVGAKAGMHKSGRPTDPDDVGAGDGALAQAAGEWLAGRLPRISPEPLRVETCLYTNLPDDRFALERRGRVVVGSACSGHGFKFAPLVGRTLARLAVEAL
jgi:sarcosine oxidase